MEVSASSSVRPAIKLLHIASFVNFICVWIYVQVSAFVIP